MRYFYNKKVAHYHVVNPHQPPAHLHPGELLLRLHLREQHVHGLGQLHPQHRIPAEGLPAEPGDLRAHRVYQGDGESDTF